MEKTSHFLGYAFSGQANLNLDLTNLFYLVDVNADYYPLNIFRYFTGKANNTLFITPSHNIFKNTFKIFSLYGSFAFLQNDLL